MAEGYWLPGIEFQCATIYSSGDVYLTLPIVTSFSCKMNVVYFPFDRQVCPITFGSWNYDRHMIVTTNYTDVGDTSVFVENGEWDLISFPVRPTTVSYNCCDDLWPEVTFTLVIQRRYLYYFLNLVLPCLMINVLGVFVFYLPPESGEKIALGVTVLLSLVVFLLMVSENMPSTSDGFPLIGKCVFIVCARRWRLYQRVYKTTCLYILFACIQKSGRKTNLPFIFILFTLSCAFVCYQLYDATSIQQLYV